MSITAALHIGMATGTVELPAFMPVGTLGTVKGVEIEIKYDTI
jgi:tRNA-guanine family transglycosylase